MIRRWFGPLAAQALGRLVLRAAGGLIAVALALAVAPVSLVAAGAYAAAWWRGLPPRRLLAAAAWCGPMVLAWLIGTARSAPAPGAARVAEAPWTAWLAFWHLAIAGAVTRALATIAPAAIPLGLIAGAAAWSYRISSVSSGTGGRSPASAVTFDQRQWQHQARAARARIAAPGSVPLTMGSDLLVAGATIRTVGHAAGTVAAIGYQRMRSHQVVVGTTGTGKTTLLLRLWAAFMATAWRRHAAGLGDPPLLVVLDCKGGTGARRTAERVRRVMREAGARSTAIWPDEDGLSLWSLPPRQLTTTLVDLIEHGTGSAAYYADVMEALVALAVEAPCGPPSSASDLLSRLEPGWLSLAYAAAGSPADHALIASASRHLTDVALRFRTLFRRLGDGLDGHGGFADADVWYCILEGTDEVTVAEGQARALVDLLASFAVRSAGRREILLAVDEFSAVSRRLPIWQLYERARSLGLAVQVSAQSWQGLAAHEDDRYRIAAAAEGGIWLLRTPHPEPLAELAGTRRVLDTSRRTGKFVIWSRQGSSGLKDVPVVDPALIRRLDVGQAAYIYRGGVTYIQVKRVVAAPAAVARAHSRAASAAADPITLHDDRPAVPAPLPAPASGTPVTRAVADASSVLDAAFGPEPAP
jgi:hypothetical protein